MTNKKTTRELRVSAQRANAARTRTVMHTSEQQKCCTRCRYSNNAHEIRKYFRNVDTAKTQARIIMRKYILFRR